VFSPPMFRRNVLLPPSRSKRMPNRDRKQLSDRSNLHDSRQQTNACRCRVFLLSHDQLCLQKTEVALLVGRHSMRGLYVLLLNKYSPLPL
jgi:hypothetical protein